MVQEPGAGESVTTELNKRTKRSGIEVGSRSRRVKRSMQDLPQKPCNMGSCDKGVNGADTRLLVSTYYGFHSFLSPFDKGV